MVSCVQFGTHKYMFKSYSSSFISEDAINQLTAPQPANMVYYESGKTLKLNRDMAKALIQQFLWTRLIESSHEPQNRSYKDKGIWRLTSKGLCVFQDFLQRAKLSMVHSTALVDVSARLMFLIQIDRLQENDRLNCEKSHITSLFSIMIASLPLRQNNDKIHYQQEIEDSYSISSSDSASSNMMRGLSFADFFPHVRTLSNDFLVTSNAKHPHQFKSTFQQQQTLLQNLSPSSNKFKMRAMFSSMLCCNWLVDYCTVASNDEAESIMTEFLKLGWIAFYDEKYKHCEHIESSKSITLHVTKKGIKVVVDVSLEKYNQLHTASEKRLSIDIFEKRNSFASSIGSSSFADSSILHSPTSEESRSMLRPKPSFRHPKTNLYDLTFLDLSPTFLDFSTDTLLKTILKTDHLRHLFRDFLSTHFGCVEILDFWIDYDRLVRNFHRQKSLHHQGNQRQVLEDAYVLWDIYLRPGTTLRELTMIDQALREAMAEDMTQRVTLVPSTRPLIVPTTAQSLDVIFEWLDKINENVCQVMANEYVPSFSRTAGYREYCTREDNRALDDFPPPPQRKSKETLYF